MAVTFTVQDLVHCKGARLAEALATTCALVWFLLGVNVRVVPQVVLSPEALATDVAGEGPLVCVCALMDHDIVALGELAMTELADESLLRSG